MAQIPLLLLYHTRMRLGEVFGLSWQDIDFAAKKITLHRQLSAWRIKALATQQAVNEKVSLICVRNDGQLVLRETFTKALIAESLNAHSFPVHAQHAETTIGSR